jgi:hypothetical protein
MFNRFIFEPNSLVIDYLKHKGKKLWYDYENAHRHNRQNSKGTLENIVIIHFIPTITSGSKSYIIDMDDYYLWKRVLKINKIKTKIK